MDTAAPTNTQGLECAYWHESYVNLGNHTSTALLGQLAALGSIGRQVLRLCITDQFVVRYRLDQPTSSRLFQKFSPSILDHLRNEFKVSELARFSKGDARTRNNPEVLGEITKRVLAARMLERGFEQVRELVQAHCPAESALAQMAGGNFKSELQERSQALEKRQPVYEMIAKSGPDHRAVFRVKVSALGVSAVGTGKTLKEAEMSAAGHLLQQIDSSRSDIESRIGHASWSPYPTALSRVQALSSHPLFRDFDSGHLALALTFSSPREFGSNGPLKQLGDAVLSTIFSIHAYRQVPFDRFTRTSIEALNQGIGLEKLLSDAYQALKLERYITFRDGRFAITNARKGEVMKALIGAAYLSFPSLEALIKRIESVSRPVLDSALSECLAKDSAGNFKSDLQELFQLIPGITPTYACKTHGAQHRLTFEAELNVQLAESVHLKTTGQGRTSTEAELNAAQQAISLLVSPPRESFSTASWFWDQVLKRIRQGRVTRIRSVLGIGQLRQMDAIASYASIARFFCSFGSLIQEDDVAVLSQVVALSVSDVEFFETKEIVNLAYAGLQRIEEISPECHEDLVRTIDAWLLQIRDHLPAIKLPSSTVTTSRDKAEMADLRHLRLKHLHLTFDLQLAETTEAAFSHVVTVLDFLDERIQQDLGVHVRSERSEVGGVVILSTKPDAQVSSIMRNANRRLQANAFFSGCRSDVRSDSGQLLYAVRYVRATSPNLQSDLYLLIMNALLKGQGYVTALYSILHDMKNEILTIRNFASSLNGQGKSYRAYAQIEHLQQEIHRRSASLNSLRRVANAVANGKCRPSDVLRKLVSRELSAIPATIDLRIAEDGLSIEMPFDPDLLDSVLTNLVRNSVEAMPKGGILILELRASLKELSIRIEDSGCGMSEETVSNLFTRLKSEKGGMGIGLATVKRVVDLYHGTVGVKSELGRGTTISISLPA